MSHTYIKLGAIMNCETSSKQQKPSKPIKDFKSSLDGVKNIHQQPSSSLIRESTETKTPTIKRIKDLDPYKSLGGVKFKHPQTGETCIWVSQWGYPDGKSGIFYKKDINSNQIYPLFIDTLEESLEYEVVE
ncbi:MAG TPA: hypothetical protein PKL13_03505 [bacterium]|nr:hypothetical protein [bacterium]